MTTFIRLCSHELSSVQGHNVVVRSPGVMHRKALRLAWGLLSYVKTGQGCVPIWWEPTQAPNTSIINLEGIKAKMSNSVSQLWSEEGGTLVTASLFQTIRMLGGQGRTGVKLLDTTASKGKLLYTEKLTHQGQGLPNRLGCAHCIVAPQERRHFYANE